MAEKTIFILVVSGGMYDDRWENTVASSFDEQKLIDLQNANQKEDGEREKLHKVIRKWESDFHAAGNSVGFEPLLKRPSWPPGLGKERITQEMRDERKKIEDQNKMINARNVARAKEYTDNRKVALTAFIEENNIDWSLFWESKEDIGNYYPAPEEKYYEICSIPFLE